MKNSRDNQHGRVPTRTYFVAERRLMVAVGFNPRLRLPHEWFVAERRLNRRGDGVSRIGAGRTRRPSYVAGMRTLAARHPDPAGCLHDGAGRHFASLRNNLASRGNASSGQVVVWRSPLNPAPRKSRSRGRRKSSRQRSSGTRPRRRSSRGPKTRLASRFCDLASAANDLANYGSLIATIRYENSPPAALYAG